MVIVPSLADRDVLSRIWPAGTVSEAWSSRKNGTQQWKERSKINQRTNLGNQTQRQNFARPQKGSDKLRISRRVAVYFGSVHSPSLGFLFQFSLLLSCLVKFGSRALFADGICRDGDGGGGGGETTPRPPPPEYFLVRSVRPPAFNAILHISFIDAIFSCAMIRMKVAATALLTRIILCSLLLARPAFTSRIFFLPYNHTGNISPLKRIMQ